MLTPPMMSNLIRIEQAKPKANPKIIMNEND